MPHHHEADRPVTPHITITDITPIHPQGFGGHEFEYQSVDDLFACVRCGRYEVSVRDHTTGEISPCTGTSAQ
jgi:hypothetical protein